MNTKTGIARELLKNTDARWAIALASKLRLKIAILGPGKGSEKYQRRSLVKGHLIGKHLPIFPEEVSKEEIKEMLKEKGVLEPQIEPLLETDFHKNIIVVSKICDLAILLCEGMSSSGEFERYRKMLGDGLKVFIPLKEYNPNSEIGGMAEEHKASYNNCIFTFKDDADILGKIDECLRHEVRKKLF